MENEPLVKKKKWYQTSAGIIALLILFFPAGLYLMWRHADWNKTAKWVVTGAFGFLFFVSAITNNTKTENSITTQPTQVPQQKAVEPTQSDTIITTAPTQATVKTNNTPIPAQTKQTSPATSSTVSQQNAVRKAKSYLSFSGFSHDGLVAQLEYEKFSHEDAVYGADNSGANWNEQAAKKAKSYMDMMGYSRDGLIEQLKYEKFTQEQAEYGASAVGL